MFGLRMINDIETFQRELNQLFRSGGIVPVMQAERQPAHLSLLDSGEAFVATVPLPGVNIETLDIQVVERRLTVAAELAATVVNEAVTWHRQERQRGTFRQSLLLPLAVDTEQIEAEYKNGILRISLPKAASALPKQISVKVG